MDEILYPGLQGRQKAEETAQAAPMTLAQRLERLERKADELLFRWDAFKQSHTLRPSWFLATALLVGAVSTAVTVYTPGCAVIVDGQELGVVSNVAQFEAIEQRVEDRVSQILDREYTLDGHVTFKHRIVNKRDLSSLAGVETYLFNQVDQVTRGYVLTLDGQVLATQQNDQDLEALLASLKAPYVNANTVSAEFTTPLELRCEYVDVGQITDDLSQVTALLTSNSVEAVTYTVQKGDTTSAIAKRQDMSLADLLAMNPDVDANRLMIGQELTVRQNVPFLGVRTVDQVTYQEAVPAPVEYQDDDTMYQGDTKVLDPGADGMNLVSARITYISGVEDHRDITSTQVLSTPKTKVVAQGTKERPKTMPKGYFIWPVSGRVTSGYGGRSLFGTYNFHGGIDIYVPQGTSVKAADGGTVITSEWNRSYGYYVVISHGNGKTTYYAHNSKLLVHVGDKVYQGQTIAKSGATGNVTGPHCHFEVRINGQRQNPRNYLP